MARVALTSGCSNTFVQVEYIGSALHSLVTILYACYVEFAELTIELGDGADLTQGSGATPFLSFHRFVMNNMFPGQPDHPVMNPVTVYTSHLFSSSSILPISSRPHPILTTQNSFAP